jgi:hypothetical protein
MSELERDKRPGGGGQLKHDFIGGKWDHVGRTM